MNQRFLEEENVTCLLCGRNNICSWVSDANNPRLLVSRSWLNPKFSLVICVSVVKLSGRFCKLLWDASKWEQVAAASQHSFGSSLSLASLRDIIPVLLHILAFSCSQKSSSCLTHCIQNQRCCYQKWLAILLAKSLASCWHNRWLSIKQSQFSNFIKASMPTDCVDLLETHAELCVIRLYLCLPYRRRKTFSRSQAKSVFCCELKGPVLSPWIQTTQF